MKTSTDKVLVFAGPASTQGTPGSCRPWIDLERPDLPGQPHTYARALVFGPGGDLFLPMTVFPSKATGTDAGGVRRYHYDLTAKTWTPTAFVSPVQDGDEPASWWYLSFGNTCPVTLAYRPC